MTRRASTASRRRVAVAAVVVALALVAGAAVAFGLSRDQDRARLEAAASASAALAARVQAQDGAARAAEGARAGRAVGDAARADARDALLAAVEQGNETLAASEGEVADEAVRDALAEVLQRAKHALESTPADAAADTSSSDDETVDDEAVDETVDDEAATDDAVDEPVSADEGPSAPAAEGSGTADGEAARSSGSASVAALRALAAEVVAADEVVRTAHDEWLAERKAQQEREARATQGPRAPGGGTGGGPTRDRCETTYDGPPFYTSPPTEGGDGSNGRLPESMLQATSWGVDPKGTRYWLRKDATQALERLNAAFRARFGHDLDLDLTYRDYETQVAMRKALGSIAAVPGTSKHGTGLALDVPELPCEYGWDTPQRAWLIANGPSYGWVQPSWALRNGSNPEYWHYEFVG